MKEWSRRQSRATREANKEAATSGEATSVSQAKAPSRDEQLEQLLKNDPVWKQIAVSRETPGPSRPVGDAERQQLGTRAELREVGYYGIDFWKVLEKSKLGMGDVRDSLRNEGGLVPPWFPDIEECRKCTIGASYAKSRGGYPLSKATLVCFNQKHYAEKLAIGEAAYRDNLEAQRKGANRQDARAVEHLMRQLEPLSDQACQALAASLLAAGPVLEWQHPLGFFHKDWSYEPGSVALVSEIVASERATSSGRTVVVDDTLNSVEPGGLRMLAASLMTHHLRQSGKIETVSLKTPARSAA